MSILDLFSFKKQAQAVFSAANIKAVLDKARAAIIEKAQDTVLKGYEKKEWVDVVVISAIKNKTQYCTNKLVLWLVDRIIDSVPTITQAIYDYLKEKVENL